MKLKLRVFYLGIWLQFQVYFYFDICNLWAGLISLSIFCSPSIWSIYNSFFHSLPCICDPTWTAFTEYVFISFSYLFAVTQSKISRLFYYSNFSFPPIVCFSPSRSLQPPSCLWFILLEYTSWLGTELQLIAPEHGLSLHESNHFVQNVKSAHLFHLYFLSWLFL